MQTLQTLQAFRLVAQHHATDSAWLMKKEEAYAKNKWFEIENINQSLDCWVESLSDENIAKWMQKYAFPSELSNHTLGIIMAGNIPLVGMHDLLCGLAAGLKVNVKTSSDDSVLPKFWIEQALAHLPELQSRVVFTDNLKNIDLAIATGSNNSARYFEYYFKEIPHILRKNRNSVAVITGNETVEEAIALGHDVFDYFGLGCRNVTHLIFPENYAFEKLFQPWEQAFGGLVNHNKYVNNYHYHKALLLMNLDPHMDTGFVLAKETPELYSPVGMVGYHFYKTEEEVKNWLNNHEKEIQCVISNSEKFSQIKPGTGQKTMLWDYADNVDTLHWLLQNRD